VLCLCRCKVRTRGLDATRLKGVARGESRQRKFTWKLDLFGL
jgi:hypothetical protein